MQVKQSDSSLLQKHLNLAFSSDTIHKIEASGKSFDYAVRYNEIKKKLWMQKKITDDDHYFLIKYKPYIHGPEYQWSYDFIRNESKICMISAANQIGKSTSNIKKCITWAVNEFKNWNRLWPGMRPNLFWYFYPSGPQIDTEFKKKWQEYSPDASISARQFRSQFVGDQKLEGLMPGFPECFFTGYSLVYKEKDRDIKEINFNTGVSVQFKSYEQRVINLQSSTVFGVFIDEEIPLETFNEVQARRRAIQGYLNLVMTPTIGQDEFVDAFDESLTGTSKETFSKAFKKKISLYDCQKFINGERSIWTDEAIEEEKLREPTYRKMRVRVYGDFIKEDDLMYHSYNPEVNNFDSFELPENWPYFVGIDVGSGGMNNHPAGIVFVGTSPDYTQGCVFSAWRGDKRETSNLDIFNQYLKMKREVGREPQYRVYDGAARDFFLLAKSKGEAFEPAKKNRKDGADHVNSLFRLNMLVLNMAHPEMRKLKAELMRVPTDKKLVDLYKTYDDLCDALRYICFRINWNFKDAKDAIDFNKKYRKHRKMVIKQDPLSISKLREKHGDRYVRQLLLDKMLKKDRNWLSYQANMHEAEEEEALLNDEWDEDDFIQDDDFNSKRIGSIQWQQEHRH